MKNISIKAELLQVYTNHCIRHTVVNNLDDKGVETHHIMATTGHKSETSIKNYSRKVSVKCHHEISDMLASNTIPPKKPVKTQPKATVSIPTNDQKVVNATGAPEIPDLLELDENKTPIVEDLSDDQIIEYITQIEKTNVNIATTQHNEVYTHLHQ